MADTDVLPSRGVPRMALVDSTGVATNGSSTIAQLAAKGIQSICAVDATGVSVGGPNVAQLASAGIRSFCPVDENGVAQDSSTAIQLQTRGIRPMVLLGNTGIALTGSSDMPTLARKGLSYFCPVDESGNATTMGPVVLLSNATIQDNATVGSNVGVLSVAGGSGTYTFTLTSNPGAHFALSGTNGVNLNTATAMTVGTYPITVQAAGGVPTPVTRTFAINVIPSPVAPANTVLPVISGSTVVGQTLMTTSGTWTGFPAPGFTYQWQRGAAGTPPTNTVAPAITGTTQVGSTLTLSNGAWTGTATITYTYQWQRNGINISGATSSTYLLVTADLTTNISAVVTATNAVSGVSANSNTVGPITAAVATTTLDSAFMNTTGNSLSPDKMTVTCISSGQYTIRSVAGHATGKYYWEVTVPADFGNSIMGICSATMVNNTYNSSDGRSVACYIASGFLGSGLTGTTTCDQANLVGVYAFALDATAKKLWMKKLSGVGASGFWNATSGADPAAGTNGCVFSASSDLGTAAVYADISPGATGDVATFNFGATAYAGTPPAGFGNM